MQYTLITETGKIMQFFIKNVAETYQKALGGTLVGPDILVDDKSLV